MDVVCIQYRRTLDRVTEDVCVCVLVNTFAEDH